MHTLADKKILITGGTGGIGLAVARNFIARGASVVITGRRDSGDAIAKEIDALFIRPVITTKARDWLGLNC